MRFSDIKGQDAAVEFLKNSVKNGRLHHAYLFTGEKGTGKTLAALNFAKAINCLSMKGGEPCGVCTACVKMDKGTLPDVLIMQGSSENGTFGIDDIKKLRDLIVLKPYELSKKIFILEDASRMTQDASNTFLKVLEEPPKDSIMILVAHDKSKILPTVYSRCAVVRFNLLTKEIIKDIISKEPGVDGILADYTAHFSGGSLAAINLKNFKDILTWKNNLIDNFCGNLKPYSDEVSIFGEKSDLRKSLEVISLWYRDMVMAILNLQELVINRDRYPEIKKKALSYNIGNLIKILKLIQDAANSISLNANPKLTIGVLKMEIDDICMK